MKPFSEIRAVVILALLATLALLPMTLGTSQAKGVIGGTIFCALPVAAVVGFLAVVPKPYWTRALAVIALGAGAMLMMMELIGHEHTGLMGAILVAAGVLAIAIDNRQPQ